MTDDGFDRFWANYPRRVSKKDARKAWASLNPSPDLVEKMLAALEWQKRQPQWLKDDGQYVPYPSSWLRAERWDDEAYVPESKPMSRNPFYRETPAWREDCFRLRHQPWCPTEEYCRMRQRKSA